MRVTKFLNTKETFFCKFELQPRDTLTNVRNPTLCSIWIQGRDVKPYVNVHDQFMTLIVNNGSISKEIPHASFSFNDALKLGFGAVFGLVSDYWMPLNPDLIDYDKFLENPLDLSSYYDLK